MVGEQFCYKINNRIQLVHVRTFNKFMYTVNNLSRELLFPETINIKIKKNREIIFGLRLYVMGFSISRTYDHYQTNYPMVKFELSNILQLLYKRFYVYFPGVRPAIWNGVKIPSSYTVGVIPYIPYVADKLDYPKSEGGEVNGHKKHTRSGDIVVIVGGGRGVSAVHAAWSSGKNGKVIVLEGSEDYAQIVSDTIKLNHVQDQVDIRKVIVGPANNVYGSNVARKSLHPGDLPHCDVLELDCEGAEQNIVANMNIRPRILIVEIHPKQSNAIETLNRIRALGYNIVEYYDNQGNSLSNVEFKNALENCKLGNEGAPIIVGKKE